MGQTREQKVIKQIAGVPTIQKRTPIATDMFLPNHSGIKSHPEAINTFVPYQNAITNVDLGTKSLSTTGWLYSIGLGKSGVQNELIFNIYNNNVAYDYWGGVSVVNEGANGWSFKPNVYSRMLGHPIDLGQSTGVAHKFRNLYLSGDAFIDTLTFSGGSITDSSGAISFGNENLTTTGTLATAGYLVGATAGIDASISCLGENGLDIITLTFSKGILTAYSTC
jgi:hypothetical protein